MYQWLFILIFYLPFQIALNPLPGVDLASIRVFILLLTCFWFLQSVLKRKIRLPINFALYSLIGFLVVAGVSVLLASNQGWAIRKILFFGSIFPIYFLVTALVDSWARARKIVTTLVLTSGLIALVGLIQFLAQFVYGLDKIREFWALNILPVFSGFNLAEMILRYPSWLVELNSQTWLRAFSIFSDAHMLAFYCGLILPLGIALYLVSKDRFKKIILSIDILLFFVLLLTFTRGAYLALIGCFVIMSWLIFKYFKAKKVALILLLSLLIFVIPGNPFFVRFMSTFNLGEESNIGRIEMWQQASRIGQDNIVAGVGLGNYSVQVNPDMEYRNPTTAHNLYLDIFSEMGIFALLFWLVLVLGTIWQAYRKLQAADQQAWLYLGIIGSLIYYAAHSVFETAIYQPVILAVLLIVLGLTYVTEEK